jgi:transcriptional regulator with XRE-family HTH domain
VSHLADPPVGERIREERTKRKISLRGLARDVGVSASLISQIETGKCRPSVSTLYAITTALGVSIENVFSSPGAEPDVVVAATATATASRDAHRPFQLAVPAVPRSGPLLLAEQREVLRLDSGVTWERLGHVLGAQVDFLLVTYAPGGSSSSDGQLMRHPGTEYGYLIEGELILTLAADEHHIRPGQSVSFASPTPHRYRNDAAEPAVGVWFVSE